MKKIGYIPIHFVSFLYNEGIDIIEFRSSSQSHQDAYDKMLVKFPYCNRTLDIQVLFDNRNNTLPPDFIIINDGDFYMDYSYIIHNWNFRESNSLYQSLFLIKQLYSLEQEKRFMDLLKINMQQSIEQNKSNKLNSNFYSSRSMFLDYLEKIIFYIKSNFVSYKHLPKSFQTLDIYQEIDDAKANNEENDEMTKPEAVKEIKDRDNKDIDRKRDKDEDVIQVKQIVLSYPLDILIRDRSIQRAPILNITIPLISITDMKFWIELQLPHFIGGNGFNILKEKEDLVNYKTYISGYERYVLSQINHMKCREKIIMDIIGSNIGFVLEVDTFYFLTFALFFHYKNTSFSNKGKVYCNYLLYFVFSIEDNSKFEMQIVNSESLTIILRINIEYDMNALKTNRIIKTVISAIRECAYIKKKTIV